MQCACIYLQNILLQYTAFEIIRLEYCACIWLMAFKIDTEEGDPLIDGVTNIMVCH